MAVSPILGITLLTTNQAAKEVTINDGFSAVERSLNDALAVSLSAGNATLVTLDFQRHGAFVCSGHSVARDLVIPNLKRFFYVQNAGTGIVTVKTGTPSSTVAIPVGSTVGVRCDGAQNVLKLFDSAAAGLTPLFTSLTDVPSDYTGHGEKTVKVKADETGLEFVEYVTPTFEELSDVPAYSGNTLKYPRVKSDGTGMEFVDANPGGETEFVLLNDTPSDYTGDAGKLVRVNATEDGLEFAAKGSFLTLKELSDAPDSYTSYGGYLVAVKDDESGVEYIPYPELVVYFNIAAPGTNYGFEVGSLASWTTVLGTDHSVVTIVDGISPDSGTYLYTFYSGTEDTGSIEREIFLSPTLTDVQIDNNSQIRITYSVLSLLATSHGKLTVEAYNNVAALIGTADTGDLTTASTTVWEDKTFSYPLPIGTRSVKIILESQDDVATDECQFAWDGLVVAFRVREEQSFLSMPDTPDTFTGASLQGVRVKSDETGLEFYAITAGATTFLALTDTPSAYTAHAGEVLKVNSGETGVEFGPLSIGDLSDVDVTTVAPTDGQVLVWDDGAGEWVPGDAATGGATTLAALTDVDVTTVVPTDGQALVWDAGASEWVPGDAAGGSTTLAGLTDVDVTTVAPTDGQALIWDDGASEWVPGTVAASGSGTVAISTETANYTLVIADEWVRMNSSSALTVTIPPNSTEAIAVGQQMAIEQMGTGQVTIDPDTGVTILHTTTSNLKTRAQYSIVTLIKVATDTWVAVGDMEAAAGPAARVVAFFFTTTPASSEIMLLWTAVEPLRFADNFVGSGGDVGTNPTSSFVLDVQVNGSSVGSITISTGGSFTFATTGGDLDLASGDQLKIVAPSSVDATVANVSISLRGVITE